MTEPTLDRKTKLIEAAVPTQPITGTPAKARTKKNPARPAVSK